MMGEERGFTMTNNNNLYFVAADSKTGETVSCYVSGYEAAKRHCEFMAEYFDHVSAWNAHFTPDGVLTYGGTRVLVYTR